MIKKSKKLILLATLTLPLACQKEDDSEMVNLPPSCTESDEVENSIRYKVTFTSTWNAETHPYDTFPANAHWSRLVGATHNSEINLWQEGELASTGIKTMAETGGVAPLIDEVKNLISTNKACSALLAEKGIATASGSISLVFSVNEDFPLVSLTTMIAPSPDWFIGVDSVDLLDNGQWIEEKSIDVFPIDAGTDSGTTYVSANEPTTPREPISQIETSPFQEGVKLGTILFEKL